MPRLPHLWDADKTLLVRYGEVRPVDMGMPRTVRCSVAFDQYCDELVPLSIGGQRDGPKDPHRALRALLEAVAPGSPDYVFCASRSVLHFLHRSDYVMDQAFVSCVVCLSKWLTQKRFPDGVFAWPPPIPPNALPPPLPLAEPRDGEAVVVERAAVRDLSPRHRAGFPAMPSGGVF
jgi:hypothetical protein